MAVVVVLEEEEEEEEEKVVEDEEERRMGRSVRSAAATLRQAIIKWVRDTYDFVQ
jgi:hypothetical protein